MFKNIATQFLIILLIINNQASACPNNLKNNQIVVEDGTKETLSKIISLAKKNNIHSKPTGEIMTWTALQLIGSPYVAGLLDKSTPEYLYVSLSKTDCMLFIEEVLVLTNMIKNNQTTIHDFSNGIYKVRYHNGFSYCKRNHYFKDWALENQNHGLVSDLGIQLTNKSLPYAAHVLSDRIKNSKNHVKDYSCISKREAVINQQKLGFVSIEDLPQVLDKIKPGDIIGIVREPAGKADSIAHLGIAYVKDNEIGMIHASSGSNKKVIIEESLIKYLEKFQDIRGIILLRPY